LLLMVTELKLGLPAAARRQLLARRIRFLVAVTIAYNVIEAVVAITAGTVASSSALVGFGLDSVIEVASAVAVAWQFAGPDHQTRERTALRIIALSFFALAAYVSVDALWSLFGGVGAEHSTVGLVLAGLSLLIMPGLSYAERQAGRELGSRSAVADSKQTLLCTYLSGVLLVGLALNSIFGWSWADPIAALVIAAVAIKEAREAWRGESCCAPTAFPSEQSVTGGRTEPTPGNRDDECDCCPPVDGSLVDLSWVPDACTLPTVQQPLRVTEFDDLFRESTTAVDRIDQARTAAGLVGEDFLR
jgi:Co/Zn/Cd efflux system component